MGVVVQHVQPLISEHQLESQLVTIQLPVNESGKEGNNGPNARVPAIHPGNPDGVMESWLLALAYPSSGCSKASKE